MNIKLLLPPLVGGLGVAVYALQTSKGDKHPATISSYREEPEKHTEEPKMDKYQTRFPTYKKTNDDVKKHRVGKEDSGQGLYLVDYSDEGWWMKRAQEMKKFYEGDWQDFRDKCFEEVKSKESDWDGVLGATANYYEEASYVTNPQSVDFVSLCLQRET
ncbi:hypothetical protein MHC_01515 [Mycoplasma haemocanis str. Illinois]|uniref:Uncharacterized protein n=1 Tax=Mycoplasma haemocanis (strain Illinois) TaxID=1111676 RepID=H6N697_MYCHN|nr:hypothetical protein [Mycoplasma haemocanis]AEW45169.1 hypothetical protein MHC_01515 [Mycoplasma haemocanis str. Illinois]